MVPTLGVSRSVNGEQNENVEMPFRSDRVQGTVRDSST